MSQTRIIIEKSIEGKRYLECAGLSTDTKPSDNICTGSIYTEVDTGDVYFYDEDSDWTKEFSFQS